LRRIAISGAVFKIVGRFEAVEALEAARLVFARSFLERKEAARAQARQFSAMVSAPQP
jgi:hypothetical protein